MILMNLKNLLYFYAWDPSPKYRQVNASTHKLLNSATFNDPDSYRYVSMSQGGIKCLITKGGHHYFIKVTVTSFVTLHFFKGYIVTLTEAVKLVTVDLLPYSYSWEIIKLA